MAGPERRQGLVLARAPGNQWALEWFVDRLRSQALFDLLELAGRTTVLVVAILWVLEADDRAKERHYRAWDLINSARGSSGDGGRTAALQDLNRDGVSLAAVPLEQAYLIEVDLEGAYLGGANLERGNLERANLGYANLKGAVLSDANLQGANLRGAILWDAKLQGANLERANLGRASSVPTSWAPISGAPTCRTPTCRRSTCSAPTSGAPTCRTPSWRELT